MRKYLSEQKLEEVTQDILAEAKESGEFNGEDGYSPQKGVDYWTDEDLDSMVRNVIAAGDFATTETINRLMESIETNEPYLPLSGGTIVGALYVMNDNGILVGDETSTSYGGLQSTRACSLDDDNVNTAGYIINVDGSSKFLHRRGAYSAKEDAYLLFDADGYRFYASGEKGEILSSTGSSGEGIIPVFTALVKNERPTFNGKEIALLEDINKIKQALESLGVSID